MDRSELWEVIARIDPPAGKSAAQVDQAAFHSVQVANAAGEGIDNPFQRQRARLKAGVQERDRILGASNA